MTPDRHTFDKILRQHLSLFGSPSANQIEASRGRVRERLRSQSDAAMSEVSTAVGPSRFRRTFGVGLMLAAAASVIAFIVKAPSPQTDWLATVEAADGSHYTLQPNALLRSDSPRGTMLTLKDGSRVEMRSQSELSLDRTPDGIGIHLRTGGLIVDAAQQHDGHLYVQTKDMTVAVARTMVVVNAEESGSRVTVIEGEVRVREGALERTLNPGEQVSTSTALAKRAVKDEISWSRNADAIFAAFSKGMTQTAGPLQPFARPSNAVAPIAAAQVERPDFEEASIRQCDPDNLPEAPGGGRGGGANSFYMTPGRVNALCMTVATLIRTAYGYGPVDLDFIVGRGPMRGMNFGSVYGLGVEDGRRVRGGPEWVRSERYTVNAIAGDGVQVDTNAMRGPMLQRLLERRFQLQAHIESEQVPAFALSVARGGPTLRPAPEGSCEPMAPPPGSPALNGQPASPRTPPRNFADVRNGQKPSCGLMLQRNGPNIVFVGGGVPITALVQVLGSRLGGIRVQDRTDMKDRYNFVLEFVVDENAPGVPGLDPPGPAEPSDIPRAATIFTAVEEELGLKLDRDKGSREFIVIDRIEHPTPN